ncbi:FHA domain-containing protein DDL [Raphanus sativus]|uniref:FHA domain-containing protein DDL n=1 Tax=Raphanus sativus TaxID=3726 RepID=A0A6J0P4L9_RAPSA|nr:FHA domain-containing protein DDL [Raphanus sativus]XP_056856206.1 FHA domain-containing protein DDL-like [Raphanus sativus]KAJ4867888.1 FHA domain-containing protein DDL [Raphanus sativus]KAJ4897753.1 FHA domain-containing protein DDL [Raphanus sativus]
MASESPVRHRQSPRRRSPSRRDESSRSPSPRTKRLRRAQGEREVGRGREREDSRGREKRGERERRREGDKEEKTRRNVTDLEVGDKRRRGGSGREETEERRIAEDERQTNRGRRERSASPSDRNSRKIRRSPDRPSASRHDEGSNARGRGEEPNNEDDSIARMKAAEEALAKKKKEEPSFELSGKLAEETNKYRGIPLLFNEPPEARKPNKRWRLYVFKDSEPLDEPLQLHRQSCYLFGRERRVADIPTDHPSCSKQHAVIQYREVTVEKPDGMVEKQVKPYLMDLGSTNKTYINKDPIESERYYELREKDTIKFGNSSREYVLLHEGSAE